MLTTTEQPPLVIDEHFGGLPEIAHGGYVAGTMAAELRADSAEVRLRRPVPTGRGLTVDRPEPDRVELRDGDALMAEAAPTELALEAPIPPTLAEAEAATRRFPGFDHHLFPECLVCGSRHDGLGVFPGPVTGRRLVAAAWTPAPELGYPSGRLPSALVWASLDCPQLWALMVHAPAATPDRVVTAALETRIEHPVVAGEPHVLIAWPIGREGRRWLAGAALFAPGGELCAIGRQTAAVVSGWGVPLGRVYWGASTSNHPLEEEQ